LVLFWLFQQEGRNDVTHTPSFRFKLQSLTDC